MTKCISVGSVGTPVGKIKDKGQTKVDNYGSWLKMSVHLSHSHYSFLQCLNLLLWAQKI